jgi:hypothetical protein
MFVHCGERAVQVHVCPLTGEEETRLRELVVELVHEIGGLKFVFGGCGVKVCRDGCVCRWLRGCWRRSLWRCV